MRYVLCSLYLTNVHTHNGRWGVGGPPRQLSTPNIFLFRSVFNGYILSLQPVMGNIYMLKFEFYVCECFFWTVVSKCPYILCWSGECGIWLEAPSVLEHSFSTQLGTDSLNLCYHYMHCSSKSCEWVVCLSGRDDICMSVYSHEFLVWGDSGSHDASYFLSLNLLQSSMQST